MTAGRAAPPPPQAAEEAEFLRQHLATQPHNVMRHMRGDGQVWVKRAGAPHGTVRYRTMAVLAGLLRLPVLRPVPNPGGPAAIATEVRRLQDLAARGLRVPAVLAVQTDGFSMSHLGRPGEDTPSLGNEIDHAAHQGDLAAMLALWQQGLAAIDHVHASGTCLSQAFARNLVRCPDGVVAYVDFEDDPLAALPMPVCQVRDALCYVHSTAIYLRQSGALDDARKVWTDWLHQASHSPDMLAMMTTTVRRLSWLRRLPQDRRLGRDAQRLRAAYDLMAPNRG